MRKGLLLWTASFAYVAAIVTGTPDAARAGELKVASDKTITGLKFPESVAYDAKAKVFYVSQFGSELKPTQKDGAGYIGKMALDGTIEEAKFLPGDGVILNKPKGIWVAGDRLWVTDIDSVWEFDTTTKEGRRVLLPGIQFANDPTVLGDALYVSDNRGDQLYRVEPADFLKMSGEPKVTLVFSGKSINPNGVYPAADGSLLMVGYKSADEPRGIYDMMPGQAPKALAERIGQLDGVYQMKSGALLITDWKSGSLAVWDAGKGMRKLATGFKGPADFTVAPDGDGLLVAVPDLVKSEVRLIRLAD
jgi:hypothetical protein